MPASFFFKRVFNFSMWFKKYFAVILISLVSYVSGKPPNIIVFMADDTGRNDVSIHGSSQIPTPNIDALGYNGVVLNKHYTMHTCTPSRTAFLTGNYPIRAGMQGFPLAAGEPRALPINMATMAERLLKLGYNTHLVGKWHLGHQNRSVTPNGRGFQTHLGYWNGFVGYFDYEIQDQILNGFDLHRNYKAAFEYKLKYATDLFTEESSTLIQNHNTSNPMFLLVTHLAGHTGKNGILLETPTPLSAVFKKYSYIGDVQRRLYADIINRMDSSVGQVVKALSDNDMLEDSILVFMSDNGAQTTGPLQVNHGSNWPYRGMKYTLWEGGIKNVGLIWSKQLKNKHYIENTPFHITDWLPTLYAAAGGKVEDLGPIDGVNHWPLLTQGIQAAPRKDILLNIDEEDNYAGILSADGRYKLTQGTYSIGIYDDYYGDSGRANNTPKYDITSVLNSDVNTAILTVDSSTILTEEIITDMRSKLEVKQFDAQRTVLKCSKKYCLFDLQNDPTETTDISGKETDVLIKLNASLNAYRTQVVPQTNEPVDLISANPMICFGTWFNWLDPNKKCDAF